jgi:hypothetical protein
MSQRTILNSGRRAGKSEAVRFSIPSGTKIMQVGHSGEAVYAFITSLAEAHQLFPLIGAPVCLLCPCLPVLVAGDFKAPRSRLAYFSAIVAYFDGDKVTMPPLLLWELDLFSEPRLDQERPRAGKVAQERYAVWSRYLSREQRKQMPPQLRWSRMDFDGIWNHRVMP